MRIIRELRIATAIFTTIAAVSVQAETTIHLERANSSDIWFSHAWSETPISTNFVVTSRKPHGSLPAKPAKLATEVRASWVSDGLLFAIRCTETSPAQRKIHVKPGDRNTRHVVDKDDFIEIFIDPNHDGEKAFGMAINMQGAVFDALYFPQDYVQSSWSSDIHPIVRVHDNSWDVTVKVPFSAFGVTPGNGDIIGIAVSRGRRQNGKAEVTVWPRRKTFYSWWQRRDIPDPFFFADVMLSSKNGSSKVVSTTRGALVQTAAAQENTFMGYVMNDSSKSFNIAARATRTLTGVKDVVWKKSFSIPQQSIQPIQIPYPSDFEQIKFEIKDTKTGTILYKSSADRSFDMPKRIYDIGGDCYPNLVTKVANPLARNGFMTYALHLKGDEGAYQYATTMGLPYSLENTVSTMARENDTPICTVRWEINYNNLPVRAPLLRKHGLKVVFVPYAKHIANRRDGGLDSSPSMVNVSPGGKRKDSWSFRELPTERFIEDFMIAMEEGLKDYSDLIWAVILPDEQDAQFHKGLRHAISTPELQKRYPIVLEIDQRIKKEFGFGKYGLVRKGDPKEIQDRCKIATQRFLNAFATDFGERVSKKLKEINPDIVLMSDDPQGQVFPYDYAGRWKKADIVIHQTHDKAMPQDLGTSVICKFVVDTARRPEFWPCVHIEGTSSVFDMDEMREVMSRAFRNGATGVSLFNLNWGGSLGMYENIGAPERWAYLTQIARFYGEGYRAKLPKTAKVGAFYSGYSAMADYSRGIGYIYKYLGPASGSYFKFIDDFSIERDEIDLSQYEVIFVSYAEYESPKAVQALIKAVKDDGVTLVITDRNAFSLDLAGNSMPERKTLLDGLTFGDKVQSFAKVSASPAAGEPLSAILNMGTIRAAAISNAAPEEVLLQYADGSPACVRKALGKGNVIWFGFNPFLPLTGLTLSPDMPTGFDYGDDPIPDPLLVGEDPSCERFFKLLLQSLNIPLDANIWKLKLPPPEKEFIWPKNEICLSGNSMLWSLTRPRVNMNIPMLGQYRYSLQPKDVDTPDAAGWVSFSQGRLTDRIRARKDFKPLDKCVLKWDKTDKFTLDIDLGIQAKVKHINLYIRDTIPGMKLLARADDNTWQICDKTTGRETKEGIHKISLNAKGRICRELRIEFDARKEKETMTICEFDVWGTITEK